jgi:hypothetical protein
MTATAIEIRVKELDACLAMLQAPSLMVVRPIIVWRCLMVRMRLSSLIRIIRSKDFVDEADREFLRRVHAGCVELNPDRNF